MRAHVLVVTFKVVASNLSVLVSGTPCVEEVLLVNLVNRHILVFKSAEGGASRAVGVHLAEGLLHGILSGGRQIATNGSEELAEAQFAITVLVEIFEALRDLQLDQGNTKVGKSVTEFGWVQGATAVLIELLEHKAEGTKAIGSLGALGHELSTDLSKVAHLDMFGIVRVLRVQVAATRSHSLDSASLLVKIDVALKRQNCLRFIQWLSHASRNCKWIRSSSGTHVSVLTFKSFSIDSYWTGLSVITDGNTRFDFIIGLLL